MADRPMTGPPGAADADRVTDPTVVAPDRAELLFVRIGFPLLGAAAAVLLRVAAGWLVRQPIPFRAVLRALDAVEGPPGLLLAAAAGAVLGGCVALVAEADYLRVTVTDTDVTLVRGNAIRTVPRAQVAAASRQGRHLVLVGPAGGETVRQAGDVQTDRLAAAFRAHGYDWRVTP
jgi:hypothetical protein